MRKITKIIKKICLGCGKEFEVTDTVNNRKRKYCNKKCSSKVQVEKECENCGDLFLSDKWANRKFCSFICSNKYNRIYTKPFIQTRFIIDNKFECSKCKQSLDISNFQERKDRPSGINYICRNCINKTISNKNYISVTEGTKKCTKCSIELNVTMFFRAKSAKDGRASECKNCSNKRKVAKLRSDINTRLKENLRKRVREALQGTIKVGRTKELIGCSVEEVRLHLESKFTYGMTWENYGKGGWHVDHIKPCAGFDLTKEEEQRKCFHYTNLQPLWEIDNLRKGDKI